MSQMAPLWLEKTLLALYKLIQGVVMDKKYFVGLVSKIKSREILKAALRHNRREHISNKCLHIKSELTTFNYGINAELFTDEILKLASTMITNSGAKLKINTVYAVEVIISLSTWDIDYKNFFEEIYKWALDYYNVPILSFQVHLDERKPHCHLLLLLLRDGRMVGSELIGYKSEMARFKLSIYTEVGKKFGLRPDAREASRDNAEQIIQKLEGDLI